MQCLLPTLTVGTPFWAIWARKLDSSPAHSLISSPVCFHSPSSIIFFFWQPPLIVISVLGWADVLGFYSLGVLGGCPRLPNHAPSLLLSIVCEIRENSCNVSTHILSPNFFWRLGWESLMQLQIVPKLSSLFLSLFPVLSTFLSLIRYIFWILWQGLYLSPCLEVTGKIPLVFTIILWLLLTMLGVKEDRKEIIHSSFCHLYDDEAVTILYHFSSVLILSFLHALTKWYSSISLLGFRG